MNIFADWIVFKNLSIVKSLGIQYNENVTTYRLWMQENGIIYDCSITKGTSEAIDFETNYKSNANKETSTKVKVWDGTNIVTITPDGDKKRLDVNVGAVTISSIVNDSNIFLADVYSIVSKAPAIIRTYTIPSGKSFRLVVWQVDADHPLAIDVILKIDGVPTKKFYLDPSQGHNSDFLYTAPVVIATAGQVITICIEPTMPRGEVNSILVGIES